MRKKIIKLYIISLILSLFSFTSYSQEVPQRVFEGVENAPAILNNIDFNDVRNSGTWAKEAIYEVSALGFIKGYGNRVFGRKTM